MTPEEKTDEYAAKMLDLPPDWWQTATASSVLIQQFKKHLLPLLVAGSVNYQVQYNIYTGILLRHGETIVWLTAGHVVDELIQILSSPHFKLSAMAWLDGYEATQAGSVPLHRINIPMNSWRKTGLDIGAVLPSILDVGNLLKNNKVETINAGIWENLSQASPEGYYAIGFPRPWCHHSQKPAPNNKALNTVKADIACLPLEQIPPPQEFAGDAKWSDREAFYGRLLPYPDYPEFDLEDAKGMSGGPIISVERDPDGRIRYRLAGVIQSFARGQSIFRAEPVQRVAEAVDLWLEERKSHSVMVS
jgi:hypothetical protein